jgi:hypothetical protein
MPTSLTSWASRAGVLPATTVFVLFCAALALTSTPRRVGDGVEYWAMAEQLAAFRPPSAAAGDLTRLEGEAQRIGQGFDVSPVRFPHLVGADGRQDFPHFWLYPLANVPALWLTHAVGVHPNWAFTLTNCVMIAVAFYTVSRSISIVWAVLIFGGPLIWWIDKIHGDLFTVSLLAAGCALWRAAPGWTLGLIGIAAAQNPALMPVWALIAGIAGIRVWRTGGLRTGGVRGVFVGAAIGGAIIAVPLAYYMTRLGVWSPLIGYTHPGAPSIRAMLSLVADANVGLLANAPLFLAAVLVAWRPASWREWREYAIVIGAWMILLAGYAQSVNLNHGATPGINRWTMWLMPWLLLIVAASGQATLGGEASAGRARRAIVPLVATLHVAWGIWFFRPGLPEVYRYPSALAAWLWTHAPSWYAPAPEIFAERVSHREPPVLPVAWPGCTIVLLIDGQWPASCLPTADPPAVCREPDGLCYAIPSGGRTTFVDLGKASFPSVIGADRWTSDAPFMAALRTRVAAGLARDPALNGDAAANAVVRATQHVSRTNVWKGRSLLLIYVGNVQSDASLRLRVDADYRGALIDLATNQAIAEIAAGRSGEHPTDLPLPRAVDHALIWLESK